MKKNILWTGLEYGSLEHCTLTLSDGQYVVNSTIIGLYHNRRYKVDYQLKTNPQWETVFVEIKTQFDHQVSTLCFESDGKGNWSENGWPLEEFSGCIDVDISLTPFTNSLPINRLQPPLQETQLIKVLYIDILKNQQKAVQQKYTRLSSNEYLFETVPNDFEALLTVDEFGLVQQYPQLFERTFIE
jgi:uncharacterized protein